MVKNWTQAAAKLCQMRNGALKYKIMRKTNNKISF